MTWIHSVPDRCRAEATELTWDLDCARGALTEIATCWRRSLAFLPELPLRLPLRLEDATRAIEADILRLVDAGPNQSPGLAVDITGRFAALRRDMAAARAMTGGQDTADAGDALLWVSAEHALRRAGSHLLCLILQLVTDIDRSPSDPPAPAALVVSLGPGPSSS
jgi:hypothetical protein